MVISPYRYGRYQHGDSDLVTIKKISLEMREKEEDKEGGSGSGGRADHHHETETIATGQFREGLTNTKHIEKIYLTGAYKDKYRWIRKRERAYY